MTARDRIVLIGCLVLAVLVGGWILVVSPERKQAAKLGAQVSAAQAELSSAEGKLADARSAQSQYAAAYASIVSLGKAVPASQEVPSLIYQLSQATAQKNVEFSSISAGGGSSSASAPVSGATATSFTPMPFTFVFNGSFFDLEHLFHRLAGFASSTTSGSIQVSGRLLTIQSIKLSPLTSSGTKGGAGLLSGTITATAYELPGGQSVTGAASTTAPGGVAPSSSSTSTASSPTAPAIARVNP